MEILPENTQNEVELKLSEQGYVTLPFGKDDFKAFVIGLLGKPQIIEGKIREPFEIDINHIRNIFELINQRITQQNEGILIQFNARIIFSDDTSVLLNSLEELITYNVIKPIISEAIHLTFQYLIKFQDKKVPEKQEINISFVTKDSKEIKNIQKVLMRRILLSPLSSEILLNTELGYIEYSIKHTARTWGTDIESILANHFNTLIKKESSAIRFLRKYQSLLNFGFFITVLFLGILLTIKIHDNLILERNLKIEKNFKALNMNLNEISNQIKYIAKDGFFDVSSVYLLGGMVALTIAGFTAILIGNIISKPRQSYLLLSSEALKSKIESEKSYKKQFSNYIISFIIAIVIGLLTNFLYDYITKK